MEQKRWKTSFTGFQYLILTSLIVLLFWNYYETKEVHELLIGLLGGMFIGIPVPERWREERG